MDIIEADILIIGGGNAGLRAALAATELTNLKVVVTAKSLIPGGSSVMNGGHWNTYGLEGGYLDKKEATFEDLFNDTIKLGSYLNDQKLVKFALKGAANEVKKIERFGGMWPRMKRPDQFFVEHRLSAPRARHYAVHTFYSWQTAHYLYEEAIRRGIEFYPEVLMTSLHLSKGTVVGTTGIDIKSGKFIIFKAKSTVLATGGLTQLFKYSTCEKSGTGDGFAMALRIGAELINVEFLQWNQAQKLTPSELAGCRGAMLIIMDLKPENIRKVRFLNGLGKRFMKKYNPIWMEITERHQLCRAIFNEIRQGRGTKNGGIWIDFTQIPKEENERWKREYLEPQTKTRLLEAFTEKQIDWEEPFEVAPAAIHTSGGVKMNIKGETNIPGLYAVGEVSGGINGAERLGGNCNAAEAMVLGRSTGESAAKRALKLNEPKVDWSIIEKEKAKVYAPLKRDQGINPFAIKQILQDLMYFKVGIIRNETILKEAIKEIGLLKKSLKNLYVADKNSRFNSEHITAIEVINMVDIAEVMARAALFRKESRGGHFREDYPKVDAKNWTVETGIKLVNGELRIYKKPVKFTYLKPGEVGYPEGEDMISSAWLPKQYPNWPGLTKK